MLSENDNMKLLELDAHPLVDAFSQVGKTLPRSDDTHYHLLLPPEYNIPGDMTDPLLYLFVEKIDSQGTLTQYVTGEHVLLMRGNVLVPVRGFEDQFSCEVLQTTPCTTTHGLAFDMHEIMFNPFCLSPIPPLCQEIMEGYSNPHNAFAFLRTRIRSPELPAALDEIENIAIKTHITAANRDAVVEKIQDAMDTISEIVFQVKPFHFIPTQFKIRTNYIIFYAVTNLFHSKLLQVYHSSMEEDNAAAQKAVMEKHASKANPDKLDEAASHLNPLKYMDSVWDGIQQITAFFDGVIAALGDKNAAADDILPAVCDGLSRCKPLASHLVSSFQYLADVWPCEGLEERTTYVLTTCAIAASHFACGPTQTKESNSSPRNVDVDGKTAETIEMLEMLLDM